MIQGTQQLPEQSEGVEIRDCSLAELISSWVVAAAFLGVLTPICIAYRSILSPPQSAGAIALLFFWTIGLILAATALYQTRRLMKFGRSTLSLLARRTFVGGRLSGQIEFDASLDCVGPVCVRLKCNHRQHKSGDDSADSWKLVWEDELLLTGLPRTGRGHTIIPVCFDVPATCHATTIDLKAENRYKWQLEASAPVAGIDYAASFKVQLFAKPPSEELPDLPDLAAAFRDQSERQLPRGVEFSIPAPGVKRFAFGPFMQPRTCITVAIITIAAILFTMVWPPANVPRVILWVMQGITLLLIYGTGALCVRRSSIDVHPNHVEVRFSWLGFGRTRTFPRGKIADAKPCARIAGRSTCYSIDLLLHSKRRIHGGGLIRGIRDAGWIAEEVREATVVEHHPHEQHAV